MLNIKGQRRKLQIRRQGPTLHHDSRQGQHDQEQRQKKNTDPDMSHKIKDKGKEARVQGAEGPRVQGEKIPTRETVRPGSGLHYCVIKKIRIH